MIEPPPAPSNTHAVFPAVAVDAEENASRTPSLLVPAGALLHEPERHGAISMAQMARVVTALLWLGWGVTLADTFTTPAVSLIGLVIAAAGIACLAAAVLCRAPDAVRRLNVAIIGGTVAVIIVVPLVIASGVGYDTDELAYNQSAATALLHGSNPYPMNFSASLPTFGVQEGETLRLQGTAEPYYSYPSLSFLLYVPAVALFGARSHAAVLVDVLAWAAAALVMWRILGEPLRQWVPVLVLAPVLVGQVIHGLTDSLYVPFELIAVCAWDRFADNDASWRRRWLGPIALGLACAVKQPPWLLAPFLVAGVAMEARARGMRPLPVVARYTAVAGAAFLLPNLAFIAWNPAAWVAGVTLPAIGGLLPMGIGPAGLLRAFAMGGGDLSLFSVAAGASLLGTLALLVVRYPALKRVLPVLPALALFVSSRSFESYFVFLVPALVVNAATVSESVPRPLGATARRLLGFAGVAGLGVATAAAMFAVLVPSPLRIGVSAATADGSELHVVAHVTNARDQAVTPHFFLGAGGYFNQEVRVTAGPGRLAAGESATYRFDAPEMAASPHAGAELQLQAGTLSPDSITSSSPVTVTGGASP